MFDVDKAKRQTLPVWNKPSPQNPFVVSPMQRATTIVTSSWAHTRILTMTTMINFFVYTKTIWRPPCQGSVNFFWGPNSYRKWRHTNFLYSYKVLFFEYLYPPLIPFWVSQEERDVFVSATGCKAWVKGNAVTRFLLISACSSLFFFIQWERRHVRGLSLSYINTVTYIYIIITSW